MRNVAHTICCVLLIAFFIGCGQASARMSVNPTSLNFGSQTVNTTTQKTFSITNTGSSSLQIQSVSASGSTTFSVYGWAGPVTLKPSQSLTLAVYFNPSAQTSYSGTITVDANRGQPRTVTMSGSGTAATTVPVTISINPSSANLQLGASQQFTAAVGGTNNTAVTWKVNGIAGGSSTVGTVNSTGLYSAPAAMPTSSTVTVSATSAADTTKTASASIVLASPVAVVSVAVSPASATVQLGGSKQFTAAVTGTTNTAVTWSVNGIAGGNSVVGTISSAGNYSAPPTMPSPSSVSVKAVSVADSTKSATATVALTSPATTTTSYYGSGLNADELANLRIGVDAKMVSVRFRAATTSTLTAIRPFVKTGSGYSGGTGGSWVIRIQTDDNSANHFPSGTTLASTTYSNLAGGGAFPVISFSSPASLTAGQLYHIVISNGDSSPTTNFVSINNLITFSYPAPLQPTMADSDWMTLCNNGSWVSNKKTPVVELDYGNGGSQGVGYIDAWSSSRPTISGSNSVRETFTVSGGDRAVLSVSLRVTRVSGSSNLTVRLENGDGTLVEQGSIPASSIGTSDTWVTYTFAGARTLTSGKSYHLVFTAPSDTTYSTEPIQKGANYGYKSTTFFPDGYGQLNTGSGWTGLRSRTDADLQFFFRY